MKSTDLIKLIINQQYPDCEISFYDFTQNHRKHGDNNLSDLDETHLNIIIKSRILNKYSRLEKHRRIIDLIKPLFQDKVHAVSIKFI